MMAEVFLVLFYIVFVLIHVIFLTVKMQGLLFIAAVFWHLKLH